MQTIKSYTNLEQSKKLVGILPLESADMYFWRRTWRENDYAISVGHSKELQEEFESTKYIEYIPCWSLAALLSILPDTITSNDGIAFELNIKKNIIEYSNPSLYLVYKSVKSDNSVDACVDMIEKLHELNLL